MKVELFHTVGCKSCAAARDSLQAVAERAVPGLVWRNVDVTKELDHAVAVGVMGLPAVAVDDDLVFASLPTPAQLVAELKRRAQGQGSGR